MVIGNDDGHGNNSFKEAGRRHYCRIKLWKIMKLKQSKVKIGQAVNGGLITCLYGIRAFIPASQLSLSYVKDLRTWVGKSLMLLLLLLLKKTVSWFYLLRK